MLLKLVTPPFFEVSVPWPAASPDPARIRAELAVADADTDDAIAARGEALEGPREIAVVAVAEDGPRAGADDPARPIAIPASFVRFHRWIGAAWLAGSATVLFLSIRRIRRFRRMLADARAASWLEQEWVDDRARRMGLRRAPELLWAAGRISPMVWCIGPRPRLIVPEDLWKGLDGQQRSTLLAHELAHLRRGDHHVRLLEVLATALYWWHPLVWWLRGPLREAEEQCCDAWVVWALPEAVRSYAETLLDTLEFLSGSVRPEPLLASGLGKVPLLRRRLTMIMTGSSRHLPGLAGKLGLLAVAGVLLPIGATRAQKADETGQVRIVAKPDVERLADLRDDQIVATVVDLSGPDADLVALHVNGQDKPATVTGSGSIDDVVEKLQAQIAELKKGDDPSEAARERVKALTIALQEIKKARGTVRFRTVRIVRPDQVKVEARVIKTERGAKDSPEIQKLSHHAAQLRKNLEANVQELRAVQDTIRKLGGDPGDVPFVSWRRTPGDDRDDVVHFSLFNKLKDGAQQTTVEQPVRKNEVRTRTYTVVKPVQQIKPMKPAEATSDSRIEALEKRLKILTGEVERLKRGSGEGEPKK